VAQVCLPQHCHGHDRHAGWGGGLRWQVLAQAQRCQQWWSQIQSWAKGQYEKNQTRDDASIVGCV